MDITTAKYLKDDVTEELTIYTIIDGKGLFVPLDPANRHYQEIMDLVEAGELTIEPAD